MNAHHHLSALERTFHRTLDQTLAAHPDVAGAIARVLAPGDGLAWTAAVGVADRAAGEPLAPDATFRIASNTKTFVAATVLRLTELGRLDLDQPIAEALAPETSDLLRDGTYDPDRITIRQVLLHASGLADHSTTDHYDAAIDAEPGRRWTRRDQVRILVDHTAPAGAPGERFSYSDTGYVLLGEIVERVARRPLAAACRELLAFSRLGLTSTYWESEEPIPTGAAPRAHQYYGEFDIHQFDPSLDLYGGGGLVSSVADLARFYRALLRGEVFAHPATLTTMEAIPPSNAEAGAAMGLFTGVAAGVTWWGHAGFWGTRAIHCPGLDLSIAVSIHQVNGAKERLEALIEALVGAFVTR